MKKLLSILILFTPIVGLFAQGEIDDQEIVLFQNERSVAGFLNSNGASASFRFGDRKTYLTKQLYDIELAYIKHPKEVKVSSSPYSYSTSRKFVYGKTNLFLSLRPSIGFQSEIYSRQDKGSLAVRYYYSGGLSLGISKPIYYTFNIVGIVDNQLYIIDTKVEKFEYSQHSTTVDIAGRASFFKGINEIKIYPGLHAKVGMSFEYNTVGQVFHALDAGFMVEAFTRKIPIMHMEENNQIFFTLFVGYRFGWIVDTRYRTPGRSPSITTINE